MSKHIFSWKELLEERVPHPNLHVRKINRRISNLDKQRNKAKNFRQKPIPPSDFSIAGKVMMSTPRGYRDNRRDSLKAGSQSILIEFARELKIELLHKYGPNYLDWPLDAIKQINDVNEKIDFISRSRATRERSRLRRPGELIREPQKYLRSNRGRI